MRILEGEAYKMRVDWLTWCSQETNEINVTSFETSSVIFGMTGHNKSVGIFQYWKKWFIQLCKDFPLNVISIILIYKGSSGIEILRPPGM